MKTRPLSVKRLFLWICIGLLLSMTAITLILFSLTLEVAVLIVGAALIGCALVWLFVLTQAFGKTAFPYLLLNYAKPLII